MSDAILKVTNLRTSFKTAAGVVRAVDGVNFELGAGRTRCVATDLGDRDQHRVGALCDYRHGWAAATRI